ncbi:SHOCT domain-containing protein [Arthrobacter sp. MDT2-16]
MLTYGRVVGGHYLNAAVQPATIGSDLVVQAGLKRRKLNETQVAEWEEVHSDQKSGAASAVGQAITGALLPRLISKNASTAVGAAIDSAVRPPRTVRVTWVDGKQSLIKLPDKLFTHLALVLADRQVETPALDLEPVPGTPGVTEQALTLLSGFVKDRSSPRNTDGNETAAPTATPEPDIADHLVKLASLRDAGILTEEEFTSKKTELLNRL